LGGLFVGTGIDMALNLYHSVALSLFSLTLSSFDVKTKFQKTYRLFDFDWWNYENSLTLDYSRP
jgi:hypothetical protein